MIGNWICTECGRKYGSREPELACYHMDKCDYCGKEKLAVTEPRDYGFPQLPEK